MSILSFLLGEKKSASVAKERLQLIIAHAARAGRRPITAGAAEGAGRGHLEVCPYFGR